MKEKEQKKRDSDRQSRERAIEFSPRSRPPSAGLSRKGIKHARLKDNPNVQTDGASTESRPKAEKRKGCKGKGVEHLLA